MGVEGRGEEVNKPLLLLLLLPTLSTFAIWEWEGGGGEFYTSVCFERRGGREREEQKRSGVGLLRWNFSFCFPAKGTKTKENKRINSGENNRIGLFFELSPNKGSADLRDNFNFLLPTQMRLFPGCWLHRNKENRKSFYYFPHSGNRKSRGKGSRKWRESEGSKLS